MQQTHVIAVVEDPFIRKYLGDVLKRRGYRVVGSEAPRAIEMLHGGSEKVDLVITNHPDEFFEVAGEVPILYLAAAPDPDMASHFPAFRALKKPFLPEQLLAAVRDLAGDAAEPQGGL